MSNFHYCRLTKVNLLIILSRIWLSILNHSFILNVLVTLTILSFKVEPSAIDASFYKKVITPYIKIDTILGVYIFNYLM